MTDLTALRNVLREAEVSLAAASREAQDAQQRFYAAVMRRDRAKAAVAAAEREAAA